MEERQAIRMFPRPRLTVRAMLALVIASAVITWLLMTAYHVNAESAWLYHQWANPSEPSLSLGGSSGIGHVAPFWPRYWRRLLGKPWPGSYDCPCDAWQSNKAGIAATEPGEKPRRSKIGDRDETGARLNRKLEGLKRMEYYRSRGESPP